MNFSENFIRQSFLKKSVNGERLSDTIIKSHNLFRSDWTNKTISWFWHFVFFRKCLNRDCSFFMTNWVLLDGFVVETNSQGEVDHSNSNPVQIVRFYAAFGIARCSLAQSVTEMLVNDMPWRPVFFFKYFYLHRVLFKLIHKIQTLLNFVLYFSGFFCNCCCCCSLIAESIQINSQEKEQPVSNLKKKCEHEKLRTRVHSVF